MTTYGQKHVWNIDVTTGDTQEAKALCGGHVPEKYRESKTAMREDKNLWGNWANGKQRHTEHNT